MQTYNTLPEDSELSFDEEITQHPRFIDAIIGTICGLAFFKRGVNDNHVVFRILGEDDEHFFFSTNTGTSAFWLKDYESVLRDAQLYCEKNFLSEPSGYGWMTR